VTVTGWGTPARQNAGGQPQFEVHAELPLDAASIAAAADLLEGVAEGARAFWGRATPDGAALDIAYQIAPTREGPPSPPRGLPALKPFKDIRAPEIPYYLGWLNYWSDAAARAIGFPAPSRDADLPPVRARRPIRPGHGGGRPAPAAWRVARWGRSAVIGHCAERPPISGKRS